MVQQSKSLTRVKTDSNFQKCSRTIFSSRFLINGQLYETQKKSSLELLLLLSYWQFRTLRLTTRHQQMSIN